MIDKKMSVIVPIYNAEKYLRNCLDCLLGQTYRNIEVILVNDGSKGNCKEIYEEYKKTDSRVKYVEHDKNMGLFQARISGVNASTGDYIAFLDSDDHITVDFFRALIYKAEETQSDIVFSNMIMELSYENNKQIQYNLFDVEFEELNGDETLDEYFNQEGLNFSWHTTPNKIYTRRIWDLALEDYKQMDKHLVMTEDFSFSSVLFYYAERVSKVDTEAMFYCKHDGASTSVDDITYKKIEKNLTDLATSFNFVESFLKKKNLYSKYESKFLKWKALYFKQHKRVTERARLNSKEKENVKILLRKINSTYELEDKNDIFSSIQTDWNNELDCVKSKMLDPKIKCVSFDIFDTLIVRPFFNPKDLFVLLNNQFRALTDNKLSLDFSNMRTYAEVMARKEINTDKQDITINDIYVKIGEIYNVPKSVLDRMRTIEEEYEIKYCTRRNTAYQLYQLAKYLNKKVVCTSDMYLGKDILRKILDKNGYNEIDEIFVSCEENAVKASINGGKNRGDLFKVVCQRLNLNPNEIMHIGDNHESDYDNPKSLGFNAIFFPKATSIASDRNYTNNMFQIFIKDLPFWEDNVASMGYIGVRSMLAVVANKYFDNPYRSFNKISNFNGDPVLIGYYALGMYLYGIARWLVNSVKKGKYDSVVFMARDGYLPMEAYKLFRKIYKDLPEEKYLYVSRKALIPVIIQNKSDYYKIPEVIDISNKTPLNIFNYIKDTIDYDKEKFRSVCQNNKIDIDKEFKDIVEYNSFVRVIIENFYNEEKHRQNLKKIKRYYDSMYVGKSANFDVGYSGRPEYFISKLCDKEIDTFFVNINSDEALRYSRKGNFKLDTFFEYKPHITGNFYETCISAMAPSCIGYDFSKDEVKPIFEEYTPSYEETFVIGKMQKAAINFVKDMLDIFGEEVEELYYQRYYITLPIQEYVHSANEFDRRIFDAFYFEDDMREKGKISVNEFWNKQLEMHNQHNIDGILNGAIYGGTVSGFDLSQRGKMARFFFYLFYDRVTLRSIINEKLYGHKRIRNIARKTYHLVKKVVRHK